MFGMKTIRRLLLAVTLVAPVGGMASTLPFLSADADLSGSILDFFIGSTPSQSLREVTVSGTITDAVNAPGAIGKTLAFNTRVFDDPGSGLLGLTAELTLGGTSFGGGRIISTTPGSEIEFEPFTSGPGVLNFPMLIIPPVTDTPNAMDPMLFDFSYGGDFDIFPDRIGAAVPEFEVLLSIFLDGPLPTRLFEEVDPDTGAVIDSYRFIGGTLPVSRITLGPVGGLPDVAPIPLPAGLPLLICALAVLVFPRRRPA